MTYNPKKGDIVTIYESNLTYVVTGETKTMYKCVAPNGCVVYQEAREMNPNDNASDRLAFIVAAQVYLNRLCDKEKQFRALFEIAQSD